jgi:hypothetical protein
MIRTLALWHKVVPHAVLVELNLCYVAFFANAKGQLVGLGVVIESIVAMLVTAHL